MSKSKWITWTAATIATGLTATIATSCAAYHALTYASQHKKETGRQLAVAENSAADNVWYLKQPLMEWHLKSDDGLTLRGTYIKADQPSKRVVLLAHGINHAREQMIPYARLFHDWHYHVLMPDARAQGESDGHRIGFGWQDRFDYQGWIQEVIDQLGDDVEIVLMGISMGASTVMATAGEKLPDNVKAVVADSGFDSLFEMAKTVVHRQYHLPAFPIVQIADRVAQLRTGTRLVTQRVSHQLKQIKVPILVIHGEDDQVVPIKQARALYQAISGVKSRYIVPNTKHIMSYAHDPKKYREVVSQFLDRYVTVND